jgi:hypothetical protein
MRDRLEAREDYENARLDVMLVPLASPIGSYFRIETFALPYVTFERLTLTRWVEEPVNDRWSAVPPETRWAARGSPVR